MPSISEIFHDFILPALIVAGALALAWWPRRNPRNGRWIGAIAIGAAFAVAEYGIGGAPRWPPGSGDAAFWLVWFTVPIALLGLLDALFHPPTWLRAGVLLLVARLGVRALLAPLGAHATGADLWSMEMWIDGLSGLAVLWWLLLETQAERMPRAIAPVILTIVATGAAVVFGVSDNVKPAQAAMALAAITTTAAVMAWPLRNLSLGRGGALAFAIPLLGLMIFVHFYSYTEPPLLSDALLLAAPLLAWIGDLHPLSRTGRWRIAFRLVPIALAVALAAALAVRASSHNSQSTTPAANPGADY